MRRLMLAVSVASSLLLTVTDNAFGHGGQYRGPGDTVPPAEGPGPGTGGPGTGGPGTGGPGTGPTTPGGGRGPTTPGGGGPQGPGGGTGTARGPVTGGGHGGGGKKNAGGGGEGFEQWQFWWENNKDSYLNLKARLAGGVVRSQGGAAFIKGKGKAEDVETGYRPSWDETANQIIPVLKEVLTEDDADIVDSAVLALGRVTPVDQSALVIEDVKKVLGNKNETPQQSALLSLGLLGSKDAVPSLIEVMKDSPDGRKLTNSNGEIHELQRSFAAISLGFIGQKETIPALLDIVHKEKDTEIGIKSSAILALGLFQDGKDEVVKELVKMLDDDKLDPTIQAQIPITLGRLGEPAAVALQSIHKLVQGKKTDHRVRQSAVIALGKLATPQDKEVIETLQGYVEDGEDEQTRHFSLIALSYIGGKAAKDPDANAEALTGITNFLTKELTGQSRSKKITHRPWAGMALALIGREFSETAQDRLSIITKLSDAFDEEKNPSYQSAYAVGLGLLNAKAAGAKIFKVMTDTNDANLKGYCAVALGMVRYVEAKDSLRKLVLDDRDPKMRLQMATALGLMGDTEVVKTLVDSLKSAKTLGVISSIAKALGLIGDRSAIEPLQGIIRDKKAPGLARGFGCVALGLIAEKTDLPWNAPLSRDANYRTVVGAQYEILDIL